MTMNTGRLVAVYRRAPLVLIIGLLGLPGMPSICASERVLTDWEWWELKGSGLSGMAMVKTRDDGVFFERIAYFDRPSNNSSS